jgi:hypothetical protein
MENQEPSTSAQKLEFIEQMIKTAQGNISGGSFHFLLWGWVIAIANLGHYYLMSISSHAHPQIIWLICLPAALMSWSHGYRQRKKSTTRTYTDRISMWLWIAMFPCLIIIIFFGYKTNFMINPLILLITGYATLQSGIIMKFKPLIIGGIIFWLASIAGFLSSYENQTLIAALAIVIGYLIPGYMLKAKHKNG